MAQVPTYKDIDRERQVANQLEEQMMSRQAVRQDTEQQGLSQANPVLQNYMDKARPQSQQNGLDAYSLATAEVANNSQNQEEYSGNMVLGAIQGQLDPRDVLSDESVFPEHKAELMRLLQNPPGLGQVR